MDAKNIQNRKSDEENLCKIDINTEPYTLPFGTLHIGFHLWPSPTRLLNNSEIKPSTYKTRCHADAISLKIHIISFQHKR